MTNRKKLRRARKTSTPPGKSVMQTQFEIIKRKLGYVFLYILFIEI